MANRQPDRCIPHIWSVFHAPSYGINPSSYPREYDPNYYHHHHHHHQDRRYPPTKPRVETKPLDDLLERLQRVEVSSQDSSPSPQPRKSKHRVASEYSDEEHYEYHGGDVSESSSSGCGDESGRSQTDEYDSEGFHDMKTTNHHKSRKPDPKSDRAKLEANQQSYHKYLKSLTEKDLSHIERHLSMKKTIRKKLSRQLQQAFLENPEALRDDRFLHSEQLAGNPESYDTSKRIGGRRKEKNVAAYNLTIAKSNMAKSESNFLDMLKDEPPLDGYPDPNFHCQAYDDPMLRFIPRCNKVPNLGRSVSTFNTTLEEDDDVLQLPDLPDYSKSRRRSTGQQSHPTSRYPDDTSTDTKKSSFWKKLTIRARSKR